MPEPVRLGTAARLEFAWKIGLAVVLPLLAMWLLSIDGNRDLRNYNLYNPHAWLTGHDAIDIARRSNSPGTTRCSTCLYT